MTWLRFRLSATLLASAYHQQSSTIGVRAFAGWHSRLNSRHHLVRMSTAAMSTSPSSPTGGGGSKGGNRLAGETSPYLLQHAHNPVDWMPWGQEAFKRAREEDKPIFLSIGYSTCHWCHVMERESFESQAVAKVLNKSFISIKVDREERPDVDQCFMTFVQATSGGGGWPMSVWLTPELKPFVGATYFPEMRFISILQTLADKWSSDRDEVVKQGDHIVRLLQERLSETAAAEGGDPLAFLAIDKSREAVREAVRVLDKGHDDLLGGWGGGRGGMKFPQPSRMNLLLRAHRLEGDESALGTRALAMVEQTLTAMAKGGIYDHLSDGFARYSTDPRWHVPHFEKMLYDQSQLITAYVEAFQVTGNAAYADVARGVLRYVLRDMTDPEGGFYSAEDADSFPFEGAAEKKEGAFCVWTEPDVKRLLDAEGAGLPGEGGDRVPVSSLFCRVYGVRPEGNVDPTVDVHGELTSQNVLFKSETVEQAAGALGLTCPTEEAEAALAAARATLMAVRKKRPAPHLDDKVLTSWNGLMISALARAAKAFSSSPPSEESLAYLGAATRTAEFVRGNLYRIGEGGADGGAGALLRSWRNGRASPVLGFADDYAFLIRGLIDLYEANPTRESGWRWLRWARELQAEMDEAFKCPLEAGGGYYGARASGVEYEGKNEEEVDVGVLPYRLRTDFDGAEPGAGSVAADNLLRLSGYFGGDDGEGLRRRAAEQLATAFALPETPQAFPELSAALVTALLGPKQVIIAGDLAEKETQALVSAAQRSFCPNLVLILQETAAAGGGNDTGRAESTGGKSEEEETALFRDVLDAYGGGFASAEGGQAATAYVCFDNSCSRPVHTVKELEGLL